MGTESIEASFLSIYALISFFYFFDSQQIFVFYLWMVHYLIKIL